MVRTNRRTTMMGLGALSLGSGAAFTVASLTESTTPGGDFRVIADERLRVLPGPAFRGGSRTGSYQNSATESKYKTEDEASSFFTTSSNNPLDDISIGDLPVAGVNDGENENLEIQVATEVQNVDEFQHLLQVENNSTENVAVGVEFSQYGTDVTGSKTDPDAIFAGDVMDIYSFYAFDEDSLPGAESTLGDGSWVKISPDGESTEGSKDDPKFTTDPNSPNYGSGTYELDSGQTHVFGLKVDTDFTMEANPSGVGDNIADHINNIASSPSFKQGNALDDVDLVDEIRFGIDDS